MAVHNVIANTKLIILILIEGKVNVQGKSTYRDDCIIRFIVSRSPASSYKWSEATLFLRNTDVSCMTAFHRLVNEF